MRCRVVIVVLTIITTVSSLLVMLFAGEPGSSAVSSPIDDPSLLVTGELHDTDVWEQPCLPAREPPASETMPPTNIALGAARGDRLSLRSFGERTSFRARFDLDETGTPRCYETFHPVRSAPGLAKADTGPDITNWLIAEFRRLRPMFRRLEHEFGATSHASVRCLEGAARGRWAAAAWALVDPAAMEWLARKLLIFASASVHPHVLNPKGAWRFRCERPPRRRDGRRTVVLCGRLWEADIAGNLLYYALGWHAGFDVRTLAVAARRFARISGGEEGAVDEALARIGTELAEFLDGDELDDAGAASRFTGALLGLVGRHESARSVRVTIPGDESGAAKYFGDLRRDRRPPAEWRWK